MNACIQGQKFANLPSAQGRRACTDRIEDVINIGVEVLVHGNLPTSIIVRVRDEMDVDFALHQIRAFKFRRDFRMHCDKDKRQQAFF